MVSDGTAGRRHPAFNLISGSITGGAVCDDPSLSCQPAVAAYAQIFDLEYNIIWIFTFQLNASSKIRKAAVHIVPLMLWSCLSQTLLGDCQ